MDLYLSTWKGNCLRVTVFNLKGLLRKGALSRPIKEKEHAGASCLYPGV